MRRARARMSSTVNRRLAAAVTRRASASVPSTLGARSESNALSRWMWASTSPGVTTHPAQATARRAGWPPSAPISAIAPWRHPTSASRPSGSRHPVRTRSNGASSGAGDVMGAKIMLSRWRRQDYGAGWQPDTAGPARFDLDRGQEGAMREAVGFIGLGNMGRPMALNLARHGFSLIVHDIDPAKTAPLAERGVAV